MLICSPQGSILIEVDIGRPSGVRIESLSLTNLMLAIPDLSNDACALWPGFKKRRFRLWPRVLLSDAIFLFL